MTYTDIRWFFCNLVEEYVFHYIHNHCVIRPIPVHIPGSLQRLIEA